MKEALYYKKFDNDIIECQLCPHNCKVGLSKVGICRVRQNIKGKLYSLNYAKPVAQHVDPIEKKPLFHFLPGKPAFSIGTIGCNLGCLHCQNWTMSKTTPKDYDVEEVLPEKIVELAIKNKCKIIAYTYNEPTIFYEYGYECSKIARKQGLKNVIVSNGYINPEPLEQWCKYLDGANIDLKGFNENFYKKVCSAKLEPVLESLKILKKNNVWLEITNLIIPTLNDDFKEIEEMCKWIKDNLGKDVPLHFSRFHPDYKLLDIEITPKETLEKAKEIAVQYLNYVYIGNIITKEHENTYCPKCKELLVQRFGYNILQNKIKDGKCTKCGNKIPGVWE